MIVQLVAAPDVTLAGLHVSDETVGSGVTVTVAVALAPSVAVRVTICDVATEAPVAVNVADVAAAGTVTEVDTGSALALLDDNATVLPPVGAVWFRVTVHVVATPAVTLGGAHASDDTRTGGVTVTVAVALPPSVAVNVAV